MTNTEDLRESFSAIANMVERASGSLSFRPSGYLTSCLRLATEGEAPVFAATDLISTKEGHAVSGSLALFTESLVAVAWLVDAVSARSHLAEHGRVIVGVTPRAALSGLRIEFDATSLNRAASLEDYAELPWGSTIVASYEGASTPVRITTGKTRLDVEPFYSSLLADLRGR